MNAQQLMNRDDKRIEALAQLTELATRLELTWSVVEDTMTITLPKPDEVELPIVAKVEVPLDEVTND